MDHATARKANYPEVGDDEVEHLWAETWKEADAIHEPERQAFQRERAEHEQLRAEKDQEIARLEAELSRVERAKALMVRS
jgi:hypothetical protein